MELFTKLLKVAKPNFPFGHIQEFCDNYRFISLLCTRMYNVFIDMQVEYHCNSHILVVISHLNSQLEMELRIKVTRVTQLTLWTQSTRIRLCKQQSSV